MTEAEIDAALALAGKAKAESLTLPARRVLELAVDVERLVGEVETLRAILSDACSESAMYAQGVRDSLAVVEAVDASADGGSSTRQGVFLARDAVRALLPPCTPP